MIRSPRFRLVLLSFLAVQLVTVLASPVHASRADAPGEPTVEPSSDGFRIEIGLGLCGAPYLPDPLPVLGPDPGGFCPCIGNGIWAIRLCFGPPEPAVESGVPEAFAPPHLESGR